MDYKTYTNEPVIRYHSTKHGWAIKKSRDVFEQMKKFLSDSLASPEARPTVEVDEIWHSFILHTRDYNAFCKTYFNEFIHHIPDSYSVSENKPKSITKANILSDCSCGGEVDYSESPSAPISETKSAIKGETLADCGGGRDT